MVGLAFERNSAARDLDLEKKKTLTTEADRSVSAIKKTYMVDILDLNFEDMFHYCFNYIGVLTGPYYSYRTFRDYFTARYWQHVNCEQVLFHRMKWIAVYAGLFLTCSYFWPISVSYISVIVEITIMIVVTFVFTQISFILLVRLVG